MKILLLATIVTLSLTQSSLVLAQPSAAATAPTTNSDLRFCGEQLPDHLPTIAERWQKTIGNRARYTDDLLDIQRKASVLFPIIEPILEQNAIPKDMKYLALVESELNSRALSRQGAAGLWQLMPQTARKLGLIVSEQNDQRYDVQKATQAACTYLWDLYKQTGSWMLTASAYNAGPTYIVQLVKQFSGIHPLLLPFVKAETQDYVYQALAYKELLTRPDNYSSFLSGRTISALTRQASMISLQDQQSVLAGIGMLQAEKRIENVPDEMSTASLADAAVIIADGTPTETLQISNLRTVALTETKSTPVAQPGSRLWPAVKTRSVTNNALTEGQLFVFEVTSPQTIDEIALAVGDVVYAHIEIIDRSSGRIYLRADRVMSSQTRETRPLKLVAVEKGHQPGVPMPVQDALASGWQLNWEKL
ncbi:MAG TPA: lytic transglycosylase domain-containing protein [Fibrella sp.]